MITINLLICDFPDGGGRTLRALSVPSFTLADGGMSVEEPSAQLMSDLGKVGDTVVKEWLEKAGTDGQAVLKAFNDSK